MEQKKSVVRTAIYKRSFNSKYGETHIHSITFDNGDTGDYLSKSKEQQKFITGKEAEYTIEKKENGQYVNYSIKPIEPAGANGFAMKGNPAIEHKRVSLKCAVDLCCSGKIEIGKIPDYANSFMKYLSE